MKHLIAKDKRRRKNFYVKELQSIVYKSFKRNRLLSSDERLNYGQLLKDLRANAIRIKNRCITTGRARSIYRNFGLTRMQFREKALFGLLSNVRKSSW
jgi:small subunit ribosomal protein S14